MKGNISKEMAEKMNKKKNLQLEPSSGHDAPKFDREDKIK
jgi:hypothetical protein